MIVRLLYDCVTMVCPLGGFDGEENIEWKADGLNDNSKVSNWQFCPRSGLTWARSYCDFGEGDSDIEGNEDKGLNHR